MEETVAQRELLRALASRAKMEKCRRYQTALARHLAEVRKVKERKNADGK